MGKGEWGREGKERRKGGGGIQHKGAQMEIKSRKRKKEKNYREDTDKKNSNSFLLIMGTKEFECRGD